jgi:hypothetical protein
MADNTDFKMLRKKDLDKGTTLKITQNLMSGRIFVEFATEDRKLVLQKNFQDSLDGKSESDKFSKSIKTTDQLREYFGVKK